MIKKKLLNAFASSLLLISGGAFAQTSTTFDYTGAMQTYTVPDGITLIQIEAWGAQGQAVTDEEYDPSTGGNGGYVTGELSVTPGDILNIYVGGMGTEDTEGYNGGGLGGLGTGSTGDTGRAGSGGGASDVRSDGTTLVDRILVAGGGGGGARDYVNGTCVPCGTGGNGGIGGNLIGGDGDDPDDADGVYFNVGAGGSGGTSSTGGAGGVGTEGTPGNAGVLGIGATGINGEYSVASGGGGGGYYGGGSGSGANPGSGVAAGGGAGGSSYVGTLTETTLTAGDREGNGQIVITEVCNATMTITTTDEIAGDDGTITLVMDSGSSPFTFDWDNDGTGDFDDDQDLTGLAAGTYNVIVKANNDCEYAGVATVDSQVSIDENGMNGLSVYPNPTINELTIVQQGSFSYTLTTVSGQTIFNGTAVNSEMINTVELPSGVYMLNVVAEGITKTIKVIRK